MRLKTSYGLCYEIIKNISPSWDSYHISVAKAHMANWNCIIIDGEYHMPIDNEYDLEVILEEAGL